MKKLRPSGYAPADMMSFTVPEWCALRRLSRGSLYNLWRRGKGPRRTVMGKRVTISREADQEWLAKVTELASE